MMPVAGRGIIFCCVIVEWNEIVKYLVAYILLLALVVALPVAVLTAPWNIDWVYWFRPNVLKWTFAWSAVSGVSIWIIGQLKMGWSDEPSL